MRTLLICLLMPLLPIISYPQDLEKESHKYQEKTEKEFNKTQEQSHHGSEVFIDTVNKRYVNQVLGAENEFSELLPESFKEYKVMPIDEITENSKPKQIPRFRKARPENFLSPLNERKIRFEMPDAILFQPNFARNKSIGLVNKVSLDFFGTTFSVDFDHQISQLPKIMKIDPEAIKNSYDFLRNTNYPAVLEQLADICRQMNLNDWDYYCLINEFCESIIDNPNLQKVISWFLLLESNFKVKIGYFNDATAILFTTAQTIYRTPCFNINGERYYTINYKYDSIYTYKTDYFKGYKCLNIFHEKPFVIEGSKRDKSITFPYMGKTYSIHVSFDQHYVDYYTKYPLIPVDFYFALPVSSTFKESVETNIAPYLQNKNTLESLHFLLSLVQYGFTYKTDEEQFKHEKYMVPEEMLYYNNSDCDDRAILFSYFVNELLHKNIIALDFNGHICPAVELTDSAIKGNLIYNSKEYIVCDPTYLGAPPGIILPPFKIKNAVIIDFNSNLNHFILGKKIWDCANKKGLLKADNAQNTYISSNGNIFLTGMMMDDSLYKSDQQNTNSENTTTFIARLDSLNEVKWIKKMKGSSSNFGYCISETDDQHLYVFGYFIDTLGLDNYKITSQEHGSFYLAKLNKNGEASWLVPICLPTDSISQGITAVLDSNGILKYYMPNDHFNQECNYLMQLDKKDNCYVYAMITQMNSSALIPRKDSITLLSRSFEIHAKANKFDIVSYLINDNDNLVKKNYPKSVSLLYTLFKYLDNYGSLISGSSIQQTILTIYKNMESGLPVQYSEVGKISEISNSDGITCIRTVDHQPVNINPLQAQHESRIKLSYINGNAKIDVLHGIKIGSDQVWNDLNYIILDKSTGQIIYNYNNQYRKKMPVHSQVL